MKLMTVNRVFVTLILLLMAACQPGSQNPTALPTLIDLNAIATNDAVTATVIAATANGNRPPPLPPTWTPSPVPTELPTSTPNPTATPIVGKGNLYYIFNGDSIARLSADGSFEQLIVASGAPADLKLSPDGTMLSYVAQGNGSAREVFISSLDGTFIQQVSCLGYSRAIDPTWSPDGDTLVFAASQTSDGPLGIYVVNSRGQCPTENNQRLIAQTERNNLNDFTWNAAGTQVFFASERIYSVSVADGVVSALTQPTGYGPDYVPLHHPLQPLLYYVKTVRNDRTGISGGRIYRVDTSDLSVTPLQEMPDTAIMARSLRWSADGRYLVISTEREALVQDQQSRSSLMVVEGSNFFPQAVLSPDTRFVAYVDGGRGARTIPQVYTVMRDGSNPTQITNHPEGTISDLNWSAN